MSGRTGFMLAVLAGLAKKICVIAKILPDIIAIPFVCKKRREAIRSSEEDTSQDHSEPEDS